MLAWAKQTFRNTEQMIVYLSCLFVQKLGNNDNINCPRIWLIYFTNRSMEDKKKYVYDYAQD